ncbi:MAG: hypothetical protein U0931_28475 [Vulcanimicrobiota bacterium]
MSLTDLAAKVKSQQQNLIPEWNKLSTQSQAISQLLKEAQAIILHQEDQVRTELNHIPPAVNAVQASLTHQFTQIQSRLDACDGQVKALKDQTESARADLEKSVTDMRSKSDQLAQTLPAVQGSLRSLLQQQRAQLEKDRQDELAAQQKLRASLDQLNQLAQQARTQSDAWRTSADHLATLCEEHLTSSIQSLTQNRDAFTHQAGASSQSYSKALDDLITTQVKPGALTTQQKTVQGLDQQVAAAARKAVDDLRVRALEALDHQVQAQLPELTQQRKQLDSSLKELTGGPQLIALLRKAKPVLQKIGKLQALGLQNI